MYWILCEDGHQRKENGQKCYKIKYTHYAYPFTLSFVISNFGSTNLSLP